MLTFSPVPTRGTFDRWAHPFSPRRVDEEAQHSGGVRNNSSSKSRVDEIVNLCDDQTALELAYKDQDHHETTPRTLVEKCKFTAKEVRQNSFVTLVAAFAVIGALCFGIDQGLMSVILVMDQFQSQFPQLRDGAPGQGFHKGLVTALLELGAFVGAFATPHISDHKGRKWAMRVGCIFFLAGAAMQTAATTYAVLVGGRFLGGIGIGLLSSTMGVYVAEIAPPALRGFLLDLNEVFVVTGVVTAYWACFGTRLLSGGLSFRLPFGLQMVPGIVLFVALFWLPESPRWLVMKGRDLEALAKLAKLRKRPQSHRGVLAEWISMRAEIDVAHWALQERHSQLIPRVDGKELPDFKDLPLKTKVKLDLMAWLDTWQGSMWRRTLIGVMLAIFQQMVGINALIYYAPSMVQALGFTYDQQLVQAGIINVTQLAGTFISIPLIDRAGRKPLLIFGGLGMAGAMVIVGVLMKLYGDSWATHAVEAKVALAFLNIYMVIFGTTWGPVPWAMPSELFPSSLRARGVAWSVMTIWIFNFIVGLIVPPMLDSIGWGTFIFFAGFSALAGTWAYFCVPETKKMPLTEIDKLFHDRSQQGEKEEEKRRNALRKFAGIVEEQGYGRVPGSEDSASESGGSAKGRVSRREDVER